MNGKWSPPLPAACQDRMMRDFVKKKEKRRVLLENLIDKIDECAMVGIQRTPIREPLERYSGREQFAALWRSITL